jgi:hypothetical protein
MLGLKKTMRHLSEDRKLHGPRYNLVTYEYKEGVIITGPRYFKSEFY